VPLVPKDATLVQFTEKEGCTTEKQIKQSIALAEQVKEAWESNRDLGSLYDE